MTSTPDRPHALLTSAQLELRIAANRAAQKEAASHKNAAAKKVLRELEKACSQLIAERNARADMQTLPF